MCRHTHTHTDVMCIHGWISTMHLQHGALTTLRHERALFTATTPWLPGQRRYLLDAAGGPGVPQPMENRRAWSLGLRSPDTGRMRAFTWLVSQLLTHKGHARVLLGSFPQHHSASALKVMSVSSKDACGMAVERQSLQRSAPQMMHLALRYGGKSF